jgi:hypothetical protein
VAIRPEPRQQGGVVPAPSTADPAPRGCLAAAAVRHARAANALGRRPAAPRGGRSLVLSPDFQTAEALKGHHEPRVAKTLLFRTDPERSLA